MVFSSLFFLFVFLPLFMAFYFVGGKIDGLRKGSCSVAVRNAVLVVFSLLFYAWGEPVYVFLMLGSVVMNYLAGLAIDCFARHRRAALAAGIACNLLLLGTFKYAGFFAGILSSVGLPVSDPRLALPIGISFYTFQSISYLVDVYRREAPAQRRFAYLLLYVSMFPQLVAGPIVRYNTVAAEIGQRSVSPADLSQGIFRFIIGLGKKVVLANQFSEIADQFLAGSLASLTTAGAWVGLLAFALQIFFDFSGYSDMAIGLGRCMGFHFAENFRHPYCCSSVTDFWRRWHISLGSFFRDYVYIPMGGNRRHQPLNIFVVWFLTGMWHGASWNFIVWGVYFGAIVAVEKFTVLRLKQAWLLPLRHIGSLALVVVGWAIFYFTDFARMGQFFGILLGGAKSLSDFVALSALTDNFWLWVAGVLFCLPVYSCAVRAFNAVFRRPTALRGGIALCSQLAVSALLLAMSVALLVGATNNAFIYTRF